MGTKSFMPQMLLLSPGNALALQYGLYTASCTFVGELYLLEKVFPGEVGDTIFPGEVDDTIRGDLKCNNITVSTILP